MKVSSWAHWYSIGYQGFDVPQGQFLTFHTCHPSVMAQQNQRPGIQYIQHLPAKNIAKTF